MLFSFHRLSIATERKKSYPETNCLFDN
ncbi:hypothetical protein FGIG_11639 [Fasciola gigantica]|uniref:Uncharacterized protein n=1 Tax=Fasciola gigantica TaxID=46835 RepID=A0A504YGE8_FASGI|nr:hypothetical protein FGIG_11639 [Fasciola gigantica]